MKLFGTDGIRAEAGRPPLDRATLPLIGQAIGEHLTGRILLARDPRESGPIIRELLRSGLLRSGTPIEDAGILPTPAVALLVKESGAGGGIMISASHNPFRDNGIKVFGPDGRKLDDDHERSIESRVAALSGNGVISESSPGRQAATGSWTAHYLDLLGRRLPPGRWLDGRTIVVDSANGAMSSIAPEYLDMLGARVISIHSTPDGININAQCGAVYPESMVDRVGAEEADFGVAFDGDGDRAIFATRSGRLVDGDAVLLVLARLMKERGILAPPVVVGTSMTNYNLEKMLADQDITLTRTAVGDRFIFQEMLRSGARIGGEPSGHVIFSDFGLSGDGLFTALKLAEAIVSTGQDLDRLTSDWRPAPQILQNLRVPERIPLESLPAVQEELRKLEQNLRGRGRLVVRYSGTEPLLRVMVESDSEALSQESADRLVQLLDRELGGGPDGPDEPPTVN